MKTAFFSALAVFVLLITACNSTPEKTPASSSTPDYLELQVGRKQGDTFSVSNPDVVKAKWEARLAHEGKKVSLADFRIKEGVTTGDEAQAYYILVANSADHKIKTASLLVLKDNTFYFDTHQDQDGLNFYSNIVCEGSCNEGCDPIVAFSNGSRYLNCSQCAECVKKEIEMR